MNIHGLKQIIKKDKRILQRSRDLGSKRENQIKRRLEANKQEKVKKKK